jgi:hypothetical protein
MLKSQAASDGKRSPSRDATRLKEEDGAEQQQCRWHPCALARTRGRQEHETTMMGYERGDSVEVLVDERPVDHDLLRYVEAGATGAAVIDRCWR